MPLAMIRASCVGSSLQLSLRIVLNAPGPCNSMTGSASGLGAPGPREGPMARRSTFFGAVPAMMNSPMPTFSPVWTFIRVERFSACATGVGVGDGVGGGVGVDGVGEDGGVGLGGMVSEGVGVTVAVGVGVGVPDGVGV